MEEINASNPQPVETLESDVKKFADVLPYWSKFIAEKILSGIAITDDHIETSYSYLLEDLKLIPETKKDEIVINYSSQQSGAYPQDLLIKAVANVQGVNALAENQKLEFSPTLTIVYGVNGSGKSGYIRLLKDVFYSKSPEPILPNIHTDSPKSIDAEFVFSSNATDSTLSYREKEMPNFKQFSVFDGKSVIRHLDNKNEFEFRPAGLSFFADFSEAIHRIEQRHNNEIATKKLNNVADTLFDGDSEIKTFASTISNKTKMEDLKKYTPFSESDAQQKTTAVKAYDDLRLSLAGTDKETKILDNTKSLLQTNKKAIEMLNTNFTKEIIKGINDSIIEAAKLVETAKSEGIENFKTEYIQNIGTEEWKNLIVAAQEFAKGQNQNDVAYPQEGDNCLLCQQPLTKDAQQLMSNLWTFVKSKAENDAKDALDRLGKVKEAYEKLNFDLLPDDNALAIWLTEKHPNVLIKIKDDLAEQKKVRDAIVKDITDKTVNQRVEYLIKVNEHDKIIEAIDKEIETLSNNDQNNLLNKLLTTKTFFEHKEKFNLHLQKFEDFLAQQIWLGKAKPAFNKRSITDTEKLLSGKYFSQKYIETFNEECEKLNGSFGIDISHTGTAGKSFRQLKLKGNSPFAVLSEGEQKVIAIADFLSEMTLSEINRGVIFDDPVTSLDETRKSEIAERLVMEAKEKQVIIFTHDLVFVSALIDHSNTSATQHSCHWIENQSGKPGTIWLNNSPSHENKYRNNSIPMESYRASNKPACPPAMREQHLKSGFAELRTCYEVLVINELFCNVVQRFNERVSIDSLTSVNFDKELIDELMDSFGQCCRYMEGHTHSDKYAYKKPIPQNLQEEIERYDAIRTKIRNAKKNVAKN